MIVTKSHGTPGLASRAPFGNHCLKQLYSAAGLKADHEARIAMVSFQKAMLDSYRRHWFTFLILACFNCWDNHHLFDFLVQLAVLKSHHR